MNAKDRTTTTQTPAKRFSEASDKAHRLDPLTMKDWEIAEAAEQTMEPIGELVSRKLNINSDEIIPYGRQLAKIDYGRTLERCGKSTRRARYIDVTAITPTPLGEGKTTTAIGLIDGLGKLGKRVTGAIRQPSSGPTFNVKGSAAGGGLAQCIPLAPFSLGLTGDVDRITNAHNLAMVALTARMQHERNYNDARLAQSNLKRLDIDPDRVQMKWVIDFCAQSLRNIKIGIGGKMDGYPMDSAFNIAVSSELMAILAVSRNLEEMRRRISKIVMAYDKQGNEITTADLEVDGAMAAWMLDTINPSVIQTIEGNPVFVHAGPFANIAIGQSSIIADDIGTKVADYHVTESGFGADIGFEKFCSMKCRLSGLKPDAAVIVCTVRALKMHGGGPAVKSGKKLSEEYTQENVNLVEKGCENLLAHIDIVKNSGIGAVVCINSFSTDTEAEIDAVRRIAEQAGAKVVCSQHWLKGGNGAIELAEAVVEACEQDNEFSFFYEQDEPLSKQVENVATKVYGADGVEYSDKALKQLPELEKDEQVGRYALCMVKTHLSLSHDQNLKGRPRNWKLPVREFLLYRGAEFVLPMAGDVKMMPGTGSNPAYRGIDIDTRRGKVTGLF